MDTNTKITTPGDRGTHSVTVTVTDGQLFSSQTVEISVLNNPPILYPISPVTVFAGDTITVTPISYDRDGDLITFTYAGWMTTSTKVTVPGDRGVHSVTVDANDGQAISSQTVQISVLNNAPQFISQPLTSVSVCSVYSYLPATFDRDNDSLSFSATSLQPGMSISPVTGQIMKVQTAGDVGTYPIQLSVTDGYGGTGYQSFTLTVLQTAWMQVVGMGVSPSSRYAHSSVYDEFNQRMVNFGGIYCPGCLWYNDVRALYMTGSTFTWTQLNPTGTPPSGRYVHRAIYDPDNKRMIVFGGYDSVIGYRDDLWALSLTGSIAWQQITPSLPRPSARANHVTVYDPVRKRMILFAGWDGTLPYFNDLWALSLTSSVSWTQLSPSGTIPQGRTGHTAIYDQLYDRIIVFGGSITGVGITNETWALNFSSSSDGSWSQVVPQGTPPSPRSLATGVYDPICGRLVIFAGYNGTYINDTWALSLVTEEQMQWDQISIVSPLPPIRYAHTAIYDPVGARMIVFDGTNNPGTGALNDIWQLK